MPGASKVVGSPVHPALVHVPVLLLVLAFSIDVVVSLGGTESWPLATWCLRLGVLGVAAACAAGFMDYRALPARSDARGDAAIHLTFHAAALVLLGASVLLRERVLTSASLAGLLLMEGVAVAMLLVSTNVGGKRTARLRESARRQVEEPQIVRMTFGPRRQSH